MKNSNGTIGNRTRDLLTCSAVPQPTAPPRSPYLNVQQEYKLTSTHTYTHKKKYYVINSAVRPTGSAHQLLKSDGLHLNKLHLSLTILYNIESFKVQCIYNFYHNSYSVLIMSF